MRIEPSSAAAGLSGGSHAKLKLPSGLVRTYSVVNGTTDRLTLGITLAEPSRGGSRELHTTVGVGTIIQVNRRLAEGAVPLFNAASHHALVAGGVGVTAFLALAEDFKGANWDYSLHLAVKSKEEVPFRERIDGLGIVLRGLLVLPLLVRAVALRLE